MLFFFHFTTLALYMSWKKEAKMCPVLVTESPGKAGPAPVGEEGEQYGPPTAMKGQLRGPPPWLLFRLQRLPCSFLETIP